MKQCANICMSSLMGTLWLNQLILNHSSLGYYVLKLFSFFSFICNRNVNLTKVAVANARHSRYCTARANLLVYFLYNFGQFVSWQLPNSRNNLFSDEVLN